MPIELKNLPSLIAIPYSVTLKKDSIQRKDFQRLTLENALTFNAIIAIADFYNHNRKRSDESDKKMIVLPNVPNIDLGQISVGTWNMFSREFTRVLKTDPKSAFQSNVTDLYHGSTAKEWENIAGTLITIRNKDAHGELIAADKLTAELDKRQVILDKLVEMLDFYKDYKLIVPIATTLESGKVVYGCKDFSGILESSITISSSKEDLELMRVYLYNVKTNNALCLNPMLVAYPISNENKEVKLYVYSKTSNKKSGNLHFLSLDSSKDFISDNTEIIGDYFTQSDICSEFQSFRIIVEDPSLHDQKKPALSVNRKLSNDFISKDEIIEMLISIKNEGEAIAENLEINFVYPESNFRICNKEGELLNGKNIIQEIIGEDISLDSGQSFDLKFYFKVIDSGQYEFPSFTVEYEYTDYQGNTVKPKIDKEGASINIETTPSIYCTIYDPSDPFSLAPVININMSVDFGTDEKGNKRIFAYIGETIPLTITITNQGLGVAKDVDFTVFVPDAVSLDHTNTNWKGNINPLQQVMKTYDLKLNEPGIHSLVVREIVYLNQDNKVFETRGGAYNILVRNKPEVQYRQLMQKVWADLDMDEDEIEELKYFSRKFGKILSEDVKKSIELDEKLKVIKSVVSNIASTKGFKLVEKVVPGNRIIYCYNTIECPFLFIDYSLTDNIKLYLRADLQGKYPKEFVTIKGILRTIEMNKIGFDEPVEGTSQSLTGGINLLKGMLGRAIGWIEKHDWLQLQMRNFFAKSLSISNEQLSAKLFTRQFYYKIESESKDSEYMIKEFATYFDSKNNLHLVAKVDADIATRKKLVEKGYKYMGSQPKESEIAYTDSTNATTYLYVGTQKLNSDEDKQKFANKLVQLLMTALEDQNNFLEDVLKKKGIEPEQVNAIMQTHNSLLQLYEQEKAALGLKGLIFKMNYEDKGKNYNLDITYYAIKELPLYQEKQIVLRISADRKNLNLYCRNIAENVIEDLNSNLIIQKGFWGYKFLLSEINSEKYQSICKSTLTLSGSSIIKPNISYLKVVFENEWVKSIYHIMKIISKNNSTASFEIITNELREQGIMTKPEGSLRQLKGTFTTFGTDVFYESNFSAKEVKIKEEYIKLIEDAINLTNIKEITSELQKINKFKLKLNSTYLQKPCEGERFGNHEQTGVWWRVSEKKSFSSLSIWISSDYNRVIYGCSLSSISKKNNDSRNDEMEERISTLLKDELFIDGFKVCLSEGFGNYKSYSMTLSNMKIPLDSLDLLEDEIFLNTLVISFNKFVDFLFPEDTYPSDNVENKLKLQ